MDEKDVEKSIPGVLIRRDKSFIKKVLGYFKMSPEGNAFFNDRILTSEDVGVSYRVISNWRDKGILPAEVSDSEGKWKKFNQVEIIWMRAVSKMRKFGLSLEAIAKIRKNVFLWNKKHDVYPLIQVYLSLAWDTYIDPYLVILENGEADIMTSSEIERFKAFRDNPSMLLISFKSLLLEDGYHIIPPSALVNLKDNEKMFIHETRTSGAKEVKAIIGRGGIREIEKTFSQNISSLAELLSKKADPNFYGEVSVAIEKGTGQSIEVKRRTRI